MPNEERGRDGVWNDGLSEVGSCAEHDAYRGVTSQTPGESLQHLPRFRELAPPEKTGKWVSYFIPANAEQLDSHMLSSERLPQHP